MKVKLRDIKKEYLKRKCDRLDNNISVEKVENDYETEFMEIMRLTKAYWQEDSKKLSLMISLVQTK